MEFDETTIKLNQIFCPGLVEDIASVEAEQKKFVYYTSADTAIQILRNEELWFRNTTVMNDYSEISYGLERLCCTNRLLTGGPLFADIPILRPL